MWTAAVTGSVVIAGLDGLLEPPQAVGPEFGQEIPHGRQAFRPHHVEPPLSLRPDRHQAGVLEHLQVLRDGLLADLEPPRDLVHRTRLVTHQPQDRPPVRVGECLERRLGHGPSLALTTSIDLYKRWLVAYLQVKTCMSVKGASDGARDGRGHPRLPRRVDGQR